MNCRQISLAVTPSKNGHKNFRFLCSAGASENTKGHGLNHGTVKQSALTVLSQMCSWPCHVDNQIPTSCQVLACQTTEFENKTFMINFLKCAISNQETRQHDERNVTGKCTTV